MCGIAGFYLHHVPACEAQVRLMCDQIRHRGPDDEGFHVDGGCAIGMRRLSIIDLNTGHQPISNEDGSLWVVFNGEIYNYRELRQDLVARGHTLRTHSDTETIVHLYEEYDLDFVRRLRGMFALALWDARRRRLCIARDRFGKKPLYYAALSEGLYFGSELKCLAAAGVPLEVDPDALRLYFQLTYIPDPFSPYRAVRKLPPASWLLYENGNLRIERYWRPDAPAAHPAPGLNEEETAARLRHLFDEAVRIRMIADVPLGAFLSGGIDSSLVVASMALQSREPVKTFSIGFAEDAYNELPWAAMLARKYNTEHHEILVRPNSVDLVSRLVRHFDEPFGDPAAIPTFIVSEFAVRHVRVALTGDGGDELFAGYTRFARAMRGGLVDRIPGAARRFIGRVAAALPYAAYGKNYLRMLSLQTPFARYLERNFANYFMRQAMLTPGWMLEEAFLTRALADYLLSEDADPLAQALYFEMMVNLPGQMLVKVDRVSMANSLEVRCPMLDQELAALALAMPHDWKIRDGRGKYLLVRCMAGRLSPELLSRPKTGFGVPLALWFRGQLREFLRDHLTGPRFLNRGLVSPRFLSHLFEEHDAARRDNSAWLFALLMIELWFRDFERLSASRAPGLSAVGR